MLSSEEEDERRGENRRSASGRERAVGYRADAPRSEPALRLTTRRLRQKLKGCDRTWTSSCFEVAALREVSPLRDVSGVDRAIHEACE